MVSGKRPILKEEFEDTKSEPVNQRRTDNTVTGKKRTNNDIQKQTVETVPTVCYYYFYFFILALYILYEKIYIDNEIQ